ncbi:hypothetical protein TNCV_1224951 [Trichonephila clavipes]|nr:hypothetical protein TNCV_1224951 [Trichonephila clavipes]
MRDCNLHQKIQDTEYKRKLTYHKGEAKDSHRSESSEQSWQSITLQEHVRQQKRWIRDIAEAVEYTRNVHYGSAAAKCYSTPKHNAKGSGMMLNESQAICHSNANRFGYWYHGANT